MSGHSWECEYEQHGVAAAAAVVVVAVVVESVGEEIEAMATFVANGVVLMAVVVLL